MAGCRQGEEGEAGGAARAGIAKQPPEESRAPGSRTGFTAAWPPSCTDHKILKRILGTSIQLLTRLGLYRALFLALTVPFGTCHLFSSTLDPVSSSERTRVGLASTHWVARPPKQVNHLISLI